MEPPCLFPQFVKFLLGRSRSGSDPLIKRLKLISNLRSHGESSSGLRILLITTNINLLGIKFDIIRANFAKTNKITLLKIANQIQKSFGITLPIKQKVKLR